MERVIVRKLSADELASVEPDAIRILGGLFDPRLGRSAWRQLQGWIQRASLDNDFSQMSRLDNESDRRAWAGALRRRFGDDRAEWIDEATGELVYWGEHDE